MSFPAKAAKVWENLSTWDSTKGIEQNVDAFVKADLIPFIEFDAKLQEESQRPMDAIALEAPGGIYGRDEKHFAEFLRRVLSRLNPESIEQLQDLTPAEDGVYYDNGWQFTFHGIRFFIITVAPYYDQHSSRFSYGGKNLIILFQPEKSFKSILSKNPNIKLNQKRKVRQIFASRGQPYEGTIVPELESGIRAHEAPRYIKPSNLSLPAVQWWKEQEGVDFDTIPVTSVPIETEVENPLFSEPSEDSALGGWCTIS